MSISAITNNAFSGMRASAKRLDATANNVANVSTPGYENVRTLTPSIAIGGVSATHQNVDNAPVDLGNEMLETISSELDFRANAEVFETGGDLWDVLISIKRD